MKIIFDSEEQKEEFIGKYCPDDFGLQDRCSPFSWHCRGELCWAEAGVEMEVRE